MKIRLSQLRRIIRETLDEQGWVPGRWYPGTAEPVSDDEVESMTHGGMGVPGDEEDESLDEAGRKRGLWDNIWARRRAGKRPKRPGEKGYPKTLDIEEEDLRQ